MQGAVWNECGTYKDIEHSATDVLVVGVEAALAGLARGHHGNNEEETPHQQHAQHHSHADPVGQVHAATEVNYVKGAMTWTSNNPLIRVTS